MYTCIYVYMYICIYVYMYLCTYVHMYICIYVYMYLCIYIWIYGYMDIWIVISLYFPTLPCQGFLDLTCSRMCSNLAYMHQHVQLPWPPLSRPKRGFWFTAKPVKRAFARGAHLVRPPFVAEASNSFICSGDKQQSFWNLRIFKGPGALHHCSIAGCILVSLPIVDIPQWIYGYMDIWYMDIWIYGYMDISTRPILRSKLQGIWAQFPGPDCLDFSGGTAIPVIPRVWWNHVESLISAINPGDHCNYRLISDDVSDACH